VKGERTMYEIKVGILFEAGSEEDAKRQFHQRMEAAGLYESDCIVSDSYEIFDIKSFMDPCDEQE
jgi:hypothetical protein